jgi:exodeoxyribonuclease VII large subunit
VPDQVEWLRQLSSTSSRIAQLGRRYLEDRFQAIDWLSRRLTQSSPAATVARQRDWLKNLHQVMVGTMRHDLSSRGRNLETMRARLLRRSPAMSVQQSIRTMNGLEQRLQVAGRNAVDRLQQKLRLAAATLNSVSPLATLDRGYSIVTDAESGRILTEASTVKIGTTVRAQLARGSLEAKVTKAKDGNGHDNQA